MFIRVTPFLLQNLRLLTIPKQFIQDIFFFLSVPKPPLPPVKCNSIYPIKTFFPSKTNPYFRIHSDTIPFSSSSVAYLFLASAKKEVSFTLAKLKKIIGYVPCSPRYFSSSHMDNPSNSLPLFLYAAKKTDQHIHHQYFAEPSRTRDQRNIIPVFPPFLNKACFIVRKVFVFYNLLKTLYSASCRSCHTDTPFYIIDNTFPFSQIQ